jgi:flagellar protein FlaG
VSIQGITNASAGTRDPATVPSSGASEHVATPTAAASPAQQAPAQPQPDAEQIKAAVDKIQKSIANSASASLNFSIDKDTGKTIIKVTDSQTGTLIRQIPSEEIMALAKSIDKMQGLLLQGKA